MRQAVGREAMLLFLWSIVAGAVGYLKRQRMAQWMKNTIVDSCASGKQLILGRLSASSPAVRPWQQSNPRHCGASDSESNDLSTSLLLWSTDSSEIVLDDSPAPLEPDCWRVFDSLTPFGPVSRAEFVWFTAICRPQDSDQRASSSAEAGTGTTSTTFSIEDVCTPVAWRTDGEQITVLFGCSIDQLTDVACAWIYGRALFRDTFEIECIATETLCPEFTRILGLEELPQSPSASKVSEKCNGAVVDGFSGTSSAASKTAITTLSLSTSGCCSRTVETITTTANGGSNRTGAENHIAGGRGLSRSSVLCSLEQLCLSDILAAKDLCRSLGAFENDLVADNGGEASAYVTCNRDFVEADAAGNISTHIAHIATSSIGSSRFTLGLEDDEMAELKQGNTAALTPLSVDIFSGVSDFLSVSSDHLSPCHGFNDRLLDRRWYSTWRCDSMDSSSFSDKVIANQPAASLPSRSSSSSKRRSTRSAMRNKSRSDSLQIRPASRRWSLPSPPQERSRSSSSSKSKFRLTPVVKPPNILIYAGEDDASDDLYARLEAVVGRSVKSQKYTIYRLKRSRFLTDPWPTNSVCVILADTAGLDDRCWQRLFEYFKCGGKMFFVCENRLLASLNDVGSAKKRYGLLKLAFHMNEQNRNQKDFKEFLKRLSKALKKPSVCEHFNMLSAAGRPRFTMSFLREEATPLILYMQNSQDQAVALFSDVTLDAVVTAGRSLINEVLQRLGLELAGGETPALTCGYLIFENEAAKEELSQEFLSLGRIDDGRTSIEFFDKNAVPPDRVTATRVYLPVWVNADDGVVDFNAADYFKHLDTEGMGRCVLYVPTATSTMTYFEGLLTKLPDKLAVVAVAKCQLEGQGRGGNRFLSPDGCAMFTIGLRIPSHWRLAHAPGYVQHLLALAAVDSVCSYREELATFHLRLKWPNDIYYGVGRLVKVGGVLVNCLARNDTLFFIAGLGLNVSNSNPTVCINDLLPPEIPSFRTEQVIALTLSRFEKLVDLFERRGQDGVLPLYYKYWLHNYQEITVAETGEPVVIRGLDKRGYLEARSRQTGRVFSLQPDGNTFDMMHNLIKIKE